ncbi:DUF3782 domain-containing protein [Thermosynechococcaceae cyanobacterium BACA0444]|uniref:DUF3782 domain-containing protein n=1 Tax=Pseudocalidococcus azoricus BACA0444 TaxID=2918990 RepID=A0AAE4FRE3_9CYAN|nr:hypothetical protein [Pseudocalidococcus azoricus]MDS3860363.1 DUF3782 domain-containing protein [Pseudocalidococcus azoricus BACA0444]
MATTSQEVWHLLGELLEAQKESDRKFRELTQESDRKFREQNQETGQQFQELKEFLRQQSEETDRRFWETDQIIGNLGNRLGEFVEWQVRPAAVRLFKERGIEVHELSRDISVQGTSGDLEIDLMVVNDNEAVLIEVKSKLTQEDVDNHLKVL